MAVGVDGLQVDGAAGAAGDEAEGGRDRGLAGEDGFGGGEEGEEGGEDEGGMHGWLMWFDRLCC